MTFVSYCDVTWNIIYFYGLKRYIFSIKKSAHKTLKKLTNDFLNVIRGCVLIKSATKSTIKSIPTNIDEIVYITVHVMQITKKVMKHVSYETGVV